MAFQDSSGSKHTNHSSYKSAESKLKAKGPNQAPPAEDSAEPMQEGGQDGAAMAQQHGPAVQIDIQHNHEQGQHSVHAMHPDGHEHESQHGSAAEAHKFAGDCAGGGM